MDDSILFVCHANLCRSPMAEQLARAPLARYGIGTASAGTHADTDRPMHPYAARAMTERGLDPAAFRSRPLRRVDLASAGLILTASRRERAACAALAPAALGRTFTLRQFARLADAARLAGGDTAGGPTPDGSPLAAAVAAAVRARSLLQSAGPGLDDLPDPVGRPVRAFRECALQIDGALRPILALIVGSG